MRALITGASSGIGESYARKLAASGYHLTITARRADRLNILAGVMRKKDGVEIEVLPVDLSVPSGIDDLKGRIADDTQPFDMLVHAAGFGTRGHLADIEEGYLSSMVNLHCLAATMLVRSVLPGMIARNYGRIVLVSSLGAFFTTAEYVLYSSTKAFLNTFAFGLREELAATDVRIQSICPGLVKTEFMDAPSFKGFHYDRVPDRFWLASDTVVKESLRRLEHRYRPIVVPGLGNKIFTGLLHAPLIGSALKGLMGVAGRRWVRAGRPALY
jgi:short-subunit dehydrogenase